MTRQTGPVPTVTSAPGTRPAALRLAVFGHVNEHGGSVSSAHFQLCRALLSAGHTLDLFAVPGFVRNPEYDSVRFSYVPVHVTVRIEFDWRYLPRHVRVLVHRLAGRTRAIRYRRRATTAARSRHKSDPYDALLFLGIPPGAPIAGIPTVVWPQGAPQNELDAIRGLAGPITRVAGRGSYLQARLYYEVKDRIVWRWTRHHRLVLASSAARDKAVRFGVPRDRVCVVPYPVDLNRFAAHEIPTDPVFRVLCIGRLDPRKRIDLLVDAVAILAQRRSDFHVEVIGKDGTVPGWSDFVADAGRTLPLTYTPAVPQAEIVHRLRHADVVVQPSEHEEFGSAIAEALACGIPVVTGPTNGTGEYVPEDGSAFFARYDAHSVAAALERALDLSRNQQARDACRVAAQCFAADRVAATLAEFIHNSTS